MDKDPRYASGTSLIRTAKEERIDCLEVMVGTFSNSLWIGLKKMTEEQLKELHRVIAARLNPPTNEEG